jgi:hypothetical protein
MIALALLVISCSSARMKIGGNSVVDIPYNGGILTISVYKHESFWRIANCLTNKNVAVYSSRLRILDNGRTLDFNIFDGYGHMVPSETVSNRDLIIFEVIPEGYKLGDKIELIVEDGFIDGIKSSRWLITES